MPEDDDEFPSATELAWEFVQKIRSGEKPSETEYLAKLPDEVNRERFKFLVSMDALANAFAHAQADLELKQALSELPKDGPDIAQG